MKRHWIKDDVDMIKYLVPLGFEYNDYSFIYNNVENGKQLSIYGSAEYVRSSRSRLLNFDEDTNNLARLLIKQMKKDNVLESDN